MAAWKFSEGSVGTALTIAIVDQDEQPVPMTGADLTDAFRFQRPGGQVFDKTPTLVPFDSADNPDNNKLRYVTVAGDLVPSGAWQLDVRVKDAGGDWRTQVKRFTVFATLT